MSVGARLRQWLFRFGPDTAVPVVLTQRRIFILPTRAGLGYGLVLFIMLIGAINYNLSLGHLLVFLLAGVGLVGMVHTFRNLAGLQIGPGRAAPVFAGETARFSLRVDNPRPHERRALEFSFAPKADTKPAPAELNLAPLSNDTIDIPCPATRRGQLEPGRITLATRYPLGLFRAWSYPHPPLACLVYPKPLDTPLPPQTTRNAYGQHPGDQGQEDFTGLRLHQPNDSPRHIAWKAVARDFDHRPLLVKQFTGGADGALYLDWALTPADGDLETRLSILCGWVLAAEGQRRNYGLVLPGVRIEPAHGQAHRDACLEALARHDETR